MNHRKLDFKTYDDALAEVERLHRGGYVKQGNWDLAQICDHVNFFMVGSLDGHQIRVPWIVKVLFGRMVLRRILTQRRMKLGGFTPQKPLPAPGGDEAAAVARFKQTVERLKTHQGDLLASPFFGYLTPEQWRDLHVIHAGHHLGFLQPK
jgi:Protein of unknown function (DUF1569)